VASCRIVGGVEEHLTVGRVAELADVTVRTLHHYDEIGLVQPSARTAAGYRAYSAGDVERLREVLAYRRLGFALREVADLVGDPSTDAVAHLRRLRELLLEQRDRAELAGPDRGPAGDAARGPPRGGVHVRRQ
jgi:DNA-binding transcriptional MerR regulator